MIELFLRLNLTRESSWIQEFNVNFSTIMISAHVFESFPKAFINAFTQLGKPFVIDPFTHILAIETLDFSDKRWYAKLIANYGLDVIIPQGERIVRVENLVKGANKPTNGLKTLVNYVLTYQRERIISSPELEEITEIAEFDGREIDANALVPKWVIPPYFLVGLGEFDEWLTVNVECVKEAVKIKNPKEQLFAVILIDSNILAFEEDINTLVSAYDINGVDGYLIWISDFRENIQPQWALDGFISFVSKLSRLRRPIYNMYGGFYSLLVNNRGLNGITHSICYGDHKDVLAEAGIMATIRYYHEDLKAKLPYGKLQDILKLSNQKMCNCIGCQELSEVRGEDREQRGLRLKFAGKHFLIKRVEEIQRINDEGVKVILSEIKSAYDKYSGSDTTGAYKQYYTHLPRWLESLKT